MAMGKHIHVGLEDNIYYKRGQSTTNVVLVQRAARIIREFNNEVAAVADVKQMLELNSKTEHDDVLCL